MANKILKTLTLPNAQGEPVTYELRPDWDKIDGKPNFDDLGGVGEAYEAEGEKKGEIFNDYQNNIAFGAGSHAEGFSTIANGDYSHAEGDQTRATGAASHAEGSFTNAWGVGAHAEGISEIEIPSTLSPDATDEEIIESWSTTGGIDFFSLASGPASHIEGVGNLTTGSYAHAEGVYNLASGTSAHAEGGGGLATGTYSHVEGYGNKASGYAAHAEGRGTIAASSAQHVQGEYNIEDQDDIYAHIVGNGDNPNARSNAHTLDWDGNAWYAGSITATKLILGPESYGTSLPETGVEGQIFFLLGGSSGTATDDGNGVITLG